MGDLEADRSMTSLTATLAAWVAETPGAAIPPEVREAARWLILDHLGCAIGGAELRPSRLLLELYREQGGEPQATVYALGKRTSLLHATYLNCALSNMIDFDDGVRGLGHPGGTTISPALAVAEHLDRIGCDVVTAVVLAYEVMLRVGRAVRPSPDRYRQVYGIGTWQTFGAIVAAGRMLGLSSGQFRDAFGLGAVNAPVPSMRKSGLEPGDRPYAWAKNNYGWAAQGGLLGALLAHRGFVGNRSILDGERGFWVMTGSDQFDPDVLTASLGEEWLLLQAGCKGYACCGWAHTALDAIREIAESGVELSPDRLRSIRLAAFFDVAGSMNVPDPVDLLDAQFSIQHVMAVELLGRSSQFGLREDDLADPEVIALRRRIEVSEDPSLSERYLATRKLPVVLTIETSDGQCFTVHAEDPWGFPERPMRHEDLLQKYHALADPVVGRATATRLRNGVLNLDEVESVRDILPHM